MKVLHVLHSIERSGAEVMLGQAASLFIANGVELHALSTGESPGRYAATMVDSGFVVHHLRFEPSPRFLLRFWRFLRLGRFDVVHVHTEQAFFWYDLVSRLAGVRLIVRSVHSVFDFRGTLWLERLLQRQFAKRVLGERPVAPSPSVQEAEHRLYGVLPLLIPNWTDPSRFVPLASSGDRMRYRKDLGIPDEALVYVSVGSCQQVKHHDAVIRALASIVGSCPRAHYLHVGGGDLEANEKLLAEDMGVGDHVTFAGQRDDISALLQASDVFVMPSSREGFGISCLEAMSCGLAVIARNASGLRDLVVDGQTGRLVQDGDGFFKAMADLYGDPQLRAAMGQSGRSRVLANFSLERSVARYLALYEAPGPDPRSVSD